MAFDDGKRIIWRDSGDAPITSGPIPELLPVTGPGYEFMRTAHRAVAQQIRDKIHEVRDCLLVNEAPALVLTGILSWLDSTYGTS